jgi:hypothetical protein
MAGMGPAPKPESQQRRKGRGLGAAAAMRLPSTGRPGDPPAWPIKRQSKREKELWARVWATPQAVGWERLGWFDEVAIYVRLLVASERPKCPAIILGERRQMADRLGLSPMSMLRLRWEITDVGDDAGPNVVDIATRMDQVAD